MRKILWITLLLVMTNHVVAAKKSEVQAQAFQKIYLSTCIKYLTNLEQLRQKMSSLPTLSDEQAERFLIGKKGTAWPIPGQPGDFVVMIEDDNNFCAVFARKLNVEIAKKQFVDNFNQTPSNKLSVKKVLDEQKNQRHSIGYNWFTPNALRKLNFMLTVTSAKHADIHALFTASIIGE